MGTPKKLSHWIILSVGLAALALALVVQAAPSARAAPTAGPVDVNVTNTPLAVTGTITASGGSIAATQSGPWTVGIAGTPTVQAPPTQILRVSAAPFQPWENTTGQLAVLESVGCSNVEQAAGAFFVGDSGGEAAIYYVFKLDDVGGYFESLFTTKIYVKPGEFLGSWTGCKFNGHTEPYGGIVTNQ